MFNWLKRQNNEKWRKGNDSFPIFGVGRVFYAGLPKILSQIRRKSKGEIKLYPKLGGKVRGEIKRGKVSEKMFII